MKWTAKGGRAGSLHRGAEDILQLICHVNFSKLNSRRTLGLFKSSSIHGYKDEEDWVVIIHGMSSGPSGRMMLLLMK